MARSKTAAVAAATTVVLTMLATLLLTVVFLTVGCDAETATTSTVAPPDSSTFNTSAPAGGSSTASTSPADTGLTLEQVRNAACIVELGEDALPFTLVDGSYQSGKGGDDPSQFDGLKVVMLDAVAFGDLNGDGVGDAAITIRVSGGEQGADRGSGADIDNVDDAGESDEDSDETGEAGNTGGDGNGNGNGNGNKSGGNGNGNGNGGGNGKGNGQGQSAGTGNGKDKGETDRSEDAPQYVIALLSQGGQPIQGGYHFVELGARVDSLAIKGEAIVVGEMVRAQEDSSGDAREPMEATLRLPFDRGGVLILTSQTSETPAGNIREIAVTSPYPGARVRGRFVISGTITIAPFENNLVYRVYDTQMVERATGPLMVEAPDLGAPGTFELALDLSSLGYTGPILVTVSDLSPANGSMLAMNSIDLLVE